MLPRTCKVALLNIGKPVPVLCADGSSFTSSIAGRRPVDHPVRLEPEGFVGDACAGRMHHGEYMRVNAFCLAHYPAMEEFAGRQLPRPAMGENLSLEGVTDADIRVGDVLRSPGGAVMHVTQPREPCSNVPRFLGVPGMLKWLVAQPLTGFYLRVLTAGDVAPGDELEFIEHGPAEWTIERLNKAMYQEIADAEQVARLLELAPLSPRWKASLAKLAERQQANAPHGTQTPS
ncbi:MAG: hypothetical protein PWP23_95 [Candidatus Sumerlaeota bacterium]|nr:hypothetical protein [Candidatus Sumerlaeota bacterium]